MSSEHFKIELIYKMLSLNCMYLLYSLHYFCTVSKCRQLSLNFKYCSLLRLDLFGIIRVSLKIWNARSKPIARQSIVLIVFFVDQSKGNKNLSKCSQIFKMLEKHTFKIKPNGIQPISLIKVSQLSKKKFDFYNSTHREYKVARTSRLKFF